MSGRACGGFGFWSKPPRFESVARRALKNSPGWCGLKSDKVWFMERSHYFHGFLIICSIINVLDPRILSFMSTPNYEP